MVIKLWSTCVALLTCKIVMEMIQTRMGMDMTPFLRVERIAMMRMPRSTLEVENSTATGSILIAMGKLMSLLS